MELHGTFPLNSMENVDAGISMEFGVLIFSMEFHGKCPNLPCKYFPWKSMEKFPWNSMEIDVLILHGIPWRIFHGNPWNSMEVFHTGDGSPNRFRFVYFCKCVEYWYSRRTGSL